MTSKNILKHNIGDFSEQRIQNIVTQKQKKFTKYDKEMYL